MTSQARSALLIARLCCIVMLAVWMPAAHPDAAPGAEGQAAPPESAATRALRAQLAQAAAHFEAEEIEAARPLLNAVLASTSFDSLTSAERHRVLLLGGRAALQADEDDTAHALLVRATAMPEADGEDWYQRLVAAYYVDLPDAAHCLTMLADRWPAQIGDLRDGAVFHIAREARSTPAHVELLDALFRAGWKIEGGAEPTSLWSDLLEARVTRGDWNGAAEVLPRLRADPTALIGFRVDHRYRRLVQAHPDLFDIDRAVEASIAEARQRAEERPELLRPLVQLAHALLQAGRAEEVLRITNRVIARHEGARRAERDSPYEDADEQMIWIANARAYALDTLGRFDEAVTQLDRASRWSEEGNKNVSQVINLASLQTAFEQPVEALQTLARVGEPSAYGRMQVELVKVQAAAIMGDAAALESALAYLREHANESEGTLQYALVRAGRLDEATAWFLERLADPALRRDALLEAQEYALEPLLTERRRIWHARWREVLARPETRAALDRVGRVERFNLSR